MNIKYVFIFLFAYTSNVILCMEGNSKKSTNGHHSPECKRAVKNCHDKHLEEFNANADNEKRLKEIMDAYIAGPKTK